MPKKNLFAAMFDVSFDEFVAPRIIKILYILAIIVAVLYAIFLFITGITILVADDPFVGSGERFFGFLMAFVGAPLLFLLILGYARVMLEVTLVFFRIESNTRPAGIGGPGAGGWPGAGGGDQPGPGGAWGGGPGAANPSQSPAPSGGQTPPPPGGSYDPPPPSGGYNPPPPAGG